MQDQLRLPTVKNQTFEADRRAYQRLQPWHSGTKMQNGIVATADS